MLLNNLILLRIGGLFLVSNIFDMKIISLIVNRMNSKPYVLVCEIDPLVIVYGVIKVSTVSIVIFLQINN